MFIAKNSVFQTKWQTPKSVLQQIKFEVKKYYENPQANKQQVFKLTRSVLPAEHVVYELCTKKPSYTEIVFDKYKETLKEFVYQLNQKRIVQPRSRGKQALIQFNKMWEQFIIFMVTISKRIFRYLDRFFTVGMDQGNLAKIGTKIFAEEVLNEREMNFICGQFINELGKIRDQRIVGHRELLKLTESLAMIGPNNLFATILELFMNETNNFYKHFYNQNIKLSPFQYLSSANNLFYFEQFLSNHVISLNHRQKIQLFQLFQKNVIQVYTQKLLTDQKGLIFFLDNKKIDALKAVAKVYSQFQGFQKIRKSVYEYCLQKGRQFIQTKSSSIKGIDQFYSFYVNLQSLINKGFQNQKEIQISFKNSIEKVSSNYQTFVQDLLKYTNQILSKGKFDQQKDKIKILFELLTSKDHFLSLYQSSLQNKILDGSFIYIIEKKFVNELNDLCGSSVTTKIDKKIQDYVSSLPVCSKFNQQTKTRIIFNSKILSFQLWQKKFSEQLACNLNLVEPITSLWKKFEQTYLEQFQANTLKLLPFESKLVIDIRFNFMYLRIKCNLLQACVIFLIANSPKQVRLSQIFTSLMIQEAIIKKFIEQCPPFIKETQIGDTYFFDWNYSGKQTFLDLDQKASQARKAPKTEIQDRDILIEAAVMKSMKKMKQAKFEQIVEQVLSRIKLFNPQTKSIKASVEKLVKKQQLEYDQTACIFTYLQ